MNRHYKTLELDKILERLAGMTSIEDAREMALNLEPVFELKKVEQLLQQTDDAVALSGRFGAPSFGGAGNCSGHLRRAQAGGCLTTGELLSVASTLRTIRTVKEWHSRSGGGASSLDGYFSGLVSNKFLEDKITSAIISEEEISDKASPVLSDIRRKIRTASSKAREVLDKIIHSSTYIKYLQDTIVTQRDGRYVVPVRSECRGNVPGLDTSSSGATVFIEPMGVVQANNDIKLLQSKEEQEIERILFELSANAGEFADSIIHSYKNLAQLNLIFAKADLAYSMKASKPIMNDRGMIELKQARHPLIDKNKVVPVDVMLGKEFDTLVITGPNTGGKTVTLKTIGLLTLMAMCGLLVPCADNSELSVFRRVLVDIGDEQSIEQSLSTFSSHMKNIVYILKKADSNSLVLFDELCAGTDPTEGAALAISILRTLHSKKITTIATTHYSELKIYALSTDGVENACCEFDVASLAPTYRLLIGIPGKSNAFAISGKLGLPSEIIENAKANIGTSAKAFEDVISDLEKSRVTIEKEQAEIELYKKEIEELKNRLKIKTERLDEKSDSIIEKAREEADAILREAKETADETIRDFNKAAKNGMTIQDLEAGRERIRKQLEKTNAKKAANKPVQTSNHTAADFHIGDKVHVISMDLDGTVHTLPDSKGFLTVSMGILNSKVNIKDLIILKEASETEKLNNKKSGIGKLKMNKTASISPEINLIGMTSDEAIIALDKYLDDAFLAHISPVRIVHGKGSGVLRNAVHNYLKRQKHVDSFRLGEFGEGDAGVTIVEFKK